MKLGGLGLTADATAEVQDIAERVRPDLEKRVGRTFPKYHAVKYATQVVAGLNFFIAVDVGEPKHFHLRVYRNLQGELQLTDFVEKDADAEMEYI
ncbi:cystatin [Gaertneriomyces semiglobifer]|nr:cystatin [Gaertneriomyces semiglobifer]